MEQRDAKPEHRFKTYAGDLLAYEKLAKEYGIVPTKARAVISPDDERYFCVTIIGYEIRKSELMFNIRLNDKQRTKTWVSHLALRGLDMPATPFCKRDMHVDPRPGAVFWKYIYTREVLAVEPCVNTGQLLVFFRKTVAYTGRQNDPPPVTIAQWCRWADGACLMQLAYKDRETA